MASKNQLASPRPAFRNFYHPYFSLQKILRPPPPNSSAIPPPPIFCNCPCLLLFHPRRPRVSRSGREKRRDESFQVRAKEPLGTDSHRTVSKNSSGCRLLIGLKKCFVLLCPIGEQFLLSSFREFVHDGYCFNHGLCGSCTKEIHAVRKLSVWYLVPRGSFARTSKLSSHPFSRPDWLPLGLRGWLLFTIKLFFLLLLFVCSEFRLFSKFNTREIKWK